MQHQSLPTADISINDVIDIIKRRRGLIIICVIVCLGIGAAITARSPKIYSATSQVVFYRPAYTVVLSSAAVAQPAVEDKSTQIYLLRGKAVAKEASDYLAAARVDVPQAEVQAALRVRDIENTDLIEISAETRDPDLSMRIANATAEAFVLYKRRVGRQNQISGMNTLNLQLSSARKDLAERARALADYKRAFTLMDVKKEADARMAQIVNNENELSRITVEREEAKARAVALAKQLSIQNTALSTTHIIRNNALIAALHEKLVDQETQLAAARQKVTDKYPGTLEQLQSAIATTRARIKSEVDNIVQHQAGSLEFQQDLKSKLATHQADYLASAARCEALRNVLSELRKKYLELPAREVKLDALTRARDAAEQVYTTLLNSYEAVKSDAVRQSDTVQVTETASKPASPIRPSPMKNMAFALIVGIIMAGFGALLMERLDDTLRTSEDAKRTLGLPVLGVIPRMADGEKLFTERHPRSPISEAYRKLRSNISFVGVDMPIRSLVVTSATVSEGKSLTCINLAMTIAQEGRKVILVDSDLRNPSIELFLGLLPGPGLTDVLRGQATLEEALRPSGVPDMRVLTAGAVPPNPAELVGSDRMREIIEQVAQLADIVVFDSSPCNLVADAVILASRVDATLQVVDTERVPREAAIQAKEALTTARARIAGVVLNRSQSAPTAYYAQDSSAAGFGKAKTGRRKR